MIEARSSRPGFFRLPASFSLRAGASQLGSTPRVGAMAMDSYIGGLDFGTSNSALAIAGANGHAQLHTFRTEHATQETFPSVLHVPPGRQPQVTAGPWAVEAYRSSGEGRLLQSIKSFVANATFEGTRIAGRLASVEELIALMLIAIRRDAEQATGGLGKSLLGRPSGSLRRRQ